MIYLTRRADFSASHFYRRAEWSEEKNHEVFGRCANPVGHGHNYVVEVTVEGTVDAVTGFVIDLKVLKDILDREIVDRYDHRHLNLEIPEFSNTMPTTENIAIAMWERLAGRIPGARLHRVRVYETEDLFADFFGETEQDGETGHGVVAETHKSFAEEGENRTEGCNLESPELA